MNALREDLRTTFRSLAKSPGYALVVVLTLALTLGANTAIFALLDAVLLRPLPFAEPERLVALWNSRPEDDAFKIRVRALDYLAWREQNDAFDRLALFSYDSRTLTGAGDPTQIFGSRVTADFFPLLGVEALHGRTLEADDFATDATPAVVTSHALWTRLLGADPEAVGRTVVLDGAPYTLIGVLPRQLMPLVAWHSGRLELGAAKAHYWLPQDAATLHPTSGVHGVVGRLAEGTTFETATARTEAIAERLETSSPATNQGYRVTLVPLLEEAVGDVSRSLWVLLGAVGLTLLIACANVANLLLVRADLRRRELAVRSALGAGRLRLWRLVTAEAALLAAAGALLGTLFAGWTLQALPRMIPIEIPRLDEAGLDPRAIALTAALCLACGLACSLVPALQAGRLDLESTLRSGGRRSGDAGSSRLRQVLVAAETGLAVVLVVGSGLLIRSFARLQAVDPGFERAQVLTFKVLPHPTAYPEMHRLTGFYDDLFRELSAIPGVASVAAAYDHPLDSNWTQAFRHLAGEKAGEWQGGVFRTVSPEYFATLGTEIVAGRGFTAGDDARSAGASIVNETFARRHFPDRAAVGERLEIGTTQWRWGEDAVPRIFEVVGVVEDERFKGLASPSDPAFYLPYAQTPHYEMTVLVRGAREPRALLPEVRARMRQLAAGVPIAQVADLDELLAAEVATPRASAAALSGFAAGSLLLAMLGTWGVLSYSVRQRTHEIGVRMALGAAGRHVFNWALWHGLKPALAGLAAGILGALALTRLLAGVLYEVGPNDPLTFVSVPVLLLAAAIVACAVPAGRAARTDPMAVLRDD